MSDKTLYDNTPEGWAQRFRQEFEAARKVLQPWHEQAEEALKAYVDERSSADDGRRRWNIFTADTQTQECMLYGSTPSVVVSRRFADSGDDVARVAGELQERILNADIARDGDTFQEAIHYALQDRQLAGFGLARIRYVTGETVVEPGRPAMIDPATGAVLAPEVPAVERRPDEQVETDYVHWKDVLWGPSRVWHEVPWVAFRAQMTREELRKMFGDVADEVPVATKAGIKQSDEGGKAPDPWSRADVWEIWVKELRRVYYYVEGFGSVLVPEGAEADDGGGVADPLGLVGFWPCPAPMVANTTTTRLVPTTDYHLARDCYRAVNDLTQRIHLLQAAVAVRGVYDKASVGIRRLLTETNENDLLPVDNWAMFAERGGIRGVIDWLPLEQVVSALAVLREQRVEAVDAARQVTGMSDIMRGQSSEPGATATEQRIKARFGSVRMERRKQEFARFASDIQRLRAEVMASRFDPQTLLARSNCHATQDAALAPKAIELLRSGASHYRIDIKPESLALADFDAVKSERTEIVGALAQYFAAVAPMAQAMPGAMPSLFQLLQWLVSGLRGSSEIEGALDQAVESAQKMAAQPQQQAPDQKLMTQQMKGQQDIAKVQAELQADIMRTQVDVQADEQREKNQAEWNTREAAARAQISDMHRATLTGRGLLP